ncbi:MAG: hypothetical protein WC707_00555 [Candidatus Babeliaceae bacterium]|jgi:hypothetical protein
MKKKILFIIFASGLPLLAANYQRDITKIIKESVAPDGITYQKKLDQLDTLLQKVLNNPKEKNAGKSQWKARITRIKQELPRASKVLMNGYDINYYERTLKQLRNQKSKYAQPLIKQKVHDFEAALNILKGNPRETISSPSPYDVQYEELVDQYIYFADKLEKLGKNPSQKDVRILAQEFTTQFDRMFQNSNQGRTKKDQLIKWLGGPEKYLGVILGNIQKNIAQSQYDKK